MTKKAAFVPMRAALGATMLYHGAQKLRGPEEAAGMFESLGFKPGERWARVTGLAEVFGGATAILGIGTRLGALAVLATQAMAIAKVHGPKGFSNLSGGYEFNLALIGMAATLLAAGPGVISAHELLERRVERPAWALARPRRRRALRFVKLLK
ncbi:DoxX family protein [Anaeromyxobacter sp. Fw109-5]|uniref:DoxX family protein n=1 Tax=Anaeromyxobacter sp. (strain Fw109-5) TaxID=404589 RepID=UPI00059DADF8|nr:DoxX family protein [Anaeromyxobacter sp. Fw109-5]